MNIKKYLFIAIGVFLAIVALAVGVSARFDLSNITADPYGFIENFFNQWSPALGAASTIILVVTVFWTIYESRRSRDREKGQVIHALHDEIHSNLTDIIRLRFQISERVRKDDDIMVRLDEVLPFQLIDTSVFDSMKNGGQLHWLEDIRMHIIFCYKLIKQYNQDATFQPYHLELLANIYDGLDKTLRELEAKFKFLPHYIKEKGESQEDETEDGDSRSQEHHEVSVHEPQKQKDNMLLQWVRKYSSPAFGVAALIPILLLISLALLFTSHGNISLLASLGFICSSVAAAIALYVAFFRANRRWLIFAIELFVFGMFFQLLGLLK